VRGVGEKSVPALGGTSLFGGQGGLIGTLGGSC